MKSKRKIPRIFIFFILPFSIHFSLFAVSSAEIVDRIVATINDHVITLSELKERSRMEKRDEKETLEGMINMVILLSEARRLGLEDSKEVVIDTPPNPNLVIGEFIDRRIKAFIQISLEMSKDFYEENKEKFRGKEFLEVRDEINLYLLERETNLRLERYLKELREKADIRILY